MDSSFSGTLWPRVRAATARGLAVGALQPIPTTFETVVDGGIAFQVRVLDSLRRKAEARQRQDLGEAPANPFLPYDRDLFVADLGETHVCLLNKFAVLEHHLLVVTREFEDQRRLLTTADLAALWTCMGEVDGLGFYNGGVEAGASQAHKHLQLAPFPLGAGFDRPPIEAAFDLGPVRGIQRSARLPFEHARVGLDDVPGDPSGAAPVLARRYGQLLEAVGVGADPAGVQTASYNLLLTRQWMMAVSRPHEHFESMSINAIGFAGGLLVFDAAGLERVREVGPLAILAQVGDTPRRAPARSTRPAR